MQIEMRMMKAVRMRTTQRVLMSILTVMKCKQRKMSLSLLLHRKLTIDFIFIRIFSFINSFSFIRGFGVLGFWGLGFRV